MAKEYRRKVSLSLLGILFPVVGGILSGHAEGGDWLSSVYIHTNETMIVGAHTHAGNNWDGIKAVTAESRQRAIEKFLAERRENEGNEGRSKDRKLRWFGLIVISALVMPLFRKFQEEFRRGNSFFKRALICCSMFAIAVIPLFVFVLNIIESVDLFKSAKQKHDELKKTFGYSQSAERQ